MMRALLRKQGDCILIGSFVVAAWTLLIGTIALKF
jgi:hypothetical protein